MSQALKSDEPVVRGDARDALIASGPAAMTPILGAWRQNPEDYRLKLGAVVVINNILRNDANIGGQIAYKLNQADITLLVDAASDSDRTVRMQATELLYGLRDTRVVSDSLNAIRQNTNENGVYNNVLILKVIVPSLDHFERKRVKDEVMRLVPASYVRARALADSIDP